MRPEERSRRGLTSCLAAQAEWAILRWHLALVITTCSVCRLSAVGFFACPLERSNARRVSQHFSHALAAPSGWWLSSTSHSTPPAAASRCRSNSASPSSPSATVRLFSELECQIFCTLVCNRLSRLLVTAGTLTLSAVSATLHSTSTAAPLMQLQGVCGGAQDWTDFASGVEQMLSCECYCAGFGVNVFLYGHVHAYERTSPVYDYNVSPYCRAVPTIACPWLPLSEQHRVLYIQGYGC